MLRIETGLIVLALLIAWLRPSLGCALFERIERRFSALARRRALSVVVVGLSTLALRAALLPILPIPKPVITDEFGYLLAADTFAHGRLTNPTHPMSDHFEALQLIQKPSYQCFEPPLQGMVLALGQVLLGHPFWGVWLSLGLMCGAVTWMLQGWTSPSWALLGGVLCTIRYGLFTYWADSYWGGTAAAIGGALVIGALPRIKDFRRVRDAVLMGIGLAILANTRPYEGLVFSLPIAAALFAWILGKNRPAFGISVRLVILPVTIVLALAAVGLGYYCWRVTGSPFRMPAQVAWDTYGGVSFIVGRPIRTVAHFSNPAMQRLYAVDISDYYRIYSSLGGYLAKILVEWRFFLGPVLTVPVVALFFTLPQNFRIRQLPSSTKFLLALFAVFLLGSAIETWYNPHYAAPAMALIVSILLLLIRQLRNWSARGLFLSRAIVTICVISFTLRAFASPLHISLPMYYEFAWYESPMPSYGRDAVEDQLLKLPGDQLVIVRYNAKHPAYKEFVYNSANIDDSKIVWALELKGEKDQQLVNYFKDRRVWLLIADDNPPKLELYTLGTTSESSTISQSSDLHGH